MNESSNTMLERAIEVAVVAHAGQVDENGDSGADSDRALKDSVAASVNRDISTQVIDRTIRRC